jgi:hypothetical protein
MVVTSDEAGIGQKEIKTDWPHEEGLELGTTKLKETDYYLEPEEKSLVASKDKVGIC